MNIIKPAPEPEDINWENMVRSKKEKLKGRIIEWVGWFSFCVTGFFLLLGGKYMTQKVFMKKKSVVGIPNISNNIGLLEIIAFVATFER